MSKFKNIDVRLTYLLLISMSFLFAFLMMRGMGIYPVVFADEWSYSSYSRLHPFDKAGVPSYLYLFFFRLTSLCGDGFLECARTINNFFIVLTLPLIYAIARQLCSTLPALVVAILSVAGPINSYAIYFMPEAMYFFGFWILSWIVLTQNTLTLERYALLVGLALGLLSLVKIHALFLLPSLVCYVLYRGWRSGDSSSLKSSVTAALILILAFAVTKLGLGYLFAGRAGVTFFGSLYGAQAGSLAQDKSLTDLVYSALVNLSGHGMALALMFGLPIVVILVTRCRRSVLNENVNDLAKQDLIVYTTLVLVPLLMLVGYFTASVSGTGPYENVGRLHMRYYNFALPLFYLIAATQLSAEAKVTRRNVVAALVVVLIAFYALWHLLAHFIPSMVDSPELRGFTFGSGFYRFFALAGVATIIAWVFNPKKAAKIFIFGVLPVVILISSWYVTVEVRKRQSPDKYDEAGQFSKRYLGSATSQLAVIAPDSAALLRTLFHIDNTRAKIVELELGSSIDIAALPPNVSWLLLIGDYKLPSKVGRVLNLGTYTLVTTHQDYQIDLKQASWPGIVSNSQGLSAPEPWGTWSIGHEVLFEFDNNLPKHIRLSMDARAFGPNEGKEFRITIGKNERSFQLKNTPQTVSFDFTLAGNERMVKISIPQPTSPKSLGLNDDSRKLGIGLNQLQITPL